MKTLKNLIFKIKKSFYTKRGKLRSKIKYYRFIYHQISYLEFDHKLKILKWYIKESSQIYQINLPSDFESLKKAALLIAHNRALLLPYSQSLKNKKNAEILYQMVVNLRSRSEYTRS